MDPSDRLELDLGKYIEILLRQWILILGAAIICALVASVFIRRTPVSYQASVLVATTKITSSVTFGSSIETLSESQLPVTLVDRKARLQSYVALVSNTVISEKVYEELKDDFGDKLPPPATLLKSVTGSALAGSDTVEISVSGDDPVMVSAIANAWGRHYVDHVNNIYGIGSFQDTLLNIQDQSKDAHSKFLDAEQAFVAFLGLSPFEEYTRLRENLIRVDRLLGDARTLLEQVERGGEGAAASNALAVSVLKTQVFATLTGIDKTGAQPSSGTPQLQANPITLQFQANPEPISFRDLLVDITSLVTTLENKSQALMERVDYLVELEQSQSAFANVEPIQSPANVSGVTAEDKIRLLTSRIEHEEGRKKDLILARDLAWNAFQNLATKEAELMIVSQTGGQEVVLASTAKATTNGGASSTRNVAIAAFVGLALGIFLAFLIEYWWGYKGREPQPLLGWNFGARGGKRN